ncbi:MAG: hypothetical protein LBJ12_01080 [Oscillospiraceae bacterium]|jgi:hypothetical protein|nr:hypothetical protein [Oscillospiraceae bacterium]
MSVLDRLKVLRKEIMHLKEWLAHLDGQGYYAAVCYGFEAARACIKWYLSLGKSNNNPTQVAEFVFGGIQVNRHKLGFWVWRG